MKAVFYVNPGLLHEDIGCGPNLEDVWRGKQASAREKFDATLIARKYDAERVGVQEIELVEEGDESEEFLKAFP